MSTPSTRRNAVLVFSKPPVPGLVKTRLSTIKDGWYTPEVAAWALPLHVLRRARGHCDALADLEARRTAERPAGEPVDTYDIIISTTPAGNVAVRSSPRHAGEWPRAARSSAMPARASTSTTNDAFAQVFALGYETILSYGAACPRSRLLGRG
jgi:hypothetical protein